jgi:dTDP-4-dehydrorhamnose reductase
MRILLFGKSGQLGWELQRSLAPLGELVALDSKSQDLCGDFLQPDGITRTLRMVAPDIIVNAAAYTAVDKAESDAELAFTVNAATPGILAEAAKASGAWLIHYSTDYVFPGKGDQAWRETDATDPLNIYGKSKLAGEEAIRATNCQHLIFRTSWVYAARGANFIKTMLRLAQELDFLTVIDDQFGAPTGAELLADVTAHAILAARQRPDISGTYHLTAKGQTNWHNYACFVIEYARQAGLNIKVAPEAIQAVPTSKFSTPAIRPKNSRLDTSKLQNTFELSLPHWQLGVIRTLNEILEK